MSWAAGQIVLLRHGETEWSRDGRHTGLTDIRLTARGEQQAARLRERLRDSSPTLVCTSPRRRARRTTELAGLRVDVVDSELAEWNYGEYEGLTTSQIRESVPGWTVWGGVCPGGETVQQVGRRADHVLVKIRPALARGGEVVLVGHGHMLRVLIARWLGLPPPGGALFLLDAGSLSLLGSEHGTPVVQRLNEPA